MPALPNELRKDLEKAVIAAREAAERGAAAAVKVLAVDQSEAFDTMTPEHRQLRSALRARARALGGSVMNGLGLLVEEVAYEHWHRMLFARFLAENGLLVHPEYGAVTLEECRGLAQEEGESDEWMVAARFAGAMLPGIFREGDPAVQVRFAPNDLHQLEKILDGLSTPVFTADDSLGWVYQFWQAKRKKEVSGSGRKIEGLALAAYSQLFTEHYMVQFLLENSLGAWWAARHPDSPLVKEFTYLRFRDDGTPAAGTFAGWPERAAEVTVMDPCCGSGHFLVAAFEMLRRMRMEEEVLGEAKAADAVLRDNLFGLEIDPRCVQIAAFALALEAWKAGGYRQVPLPNLACSGIPVSGQLPEWTNLAGDDANLKHTLERIYHLFRDSPDLGSLIDPSDVPVADRMFAPDFGKVGPLLEQALANERAVDDPVAAVFGEAAIGVARAASLLSRRYVLVATNVPYLVRNKQGETLKDFLDDHHPDSRANLATAFIERCASLSSSTCTYALVVPQNWLFLGRYERLRRQMLQRQEWNAVTILGPGAFGTISGHVVNVALQTFTNRAPSEAHAFAASEEATAMDAAGKAESLRRTEPIMVSQAEQLTHPDARIVFGTMQEGPLLQAYAISPRGIVSGDTEFWIRRFWELSGLRAQWRPLQSTVRQTTTHGGREHVINWVTHGAGMLRPGVRNPAYGHLGVAVSLLGDLNATLYTGALYDNNTGVIVPRNEGDVAAIWAYCTSTQFRDAVRQIDRKMNVTNATLLKVPFDVSRWRADADASGPLPEPYSRDPTQRLFRGDPADGTEPLHVAVARLLGYRWPKQEADNLDSLADEDGIVCVPPVSSEQPAAERLRSLLAVAYGNEWSLSLQERLLAEAGSPGKPLEQWMRDDFFAQHCKLFHNRPFIWQIWDGRKDGFSALVNYHRLDKNLLEKLTHTYLGWWIGVQRNARDQGQAGADGRLTATLDLQKKLELILEGGPPYDIYVRWKPLHGQPTGWDPDLDDGVRLNIRPFVTAGVLRRKFTINWKKDRGNNPDGSERHNDLHYTIEEKTKAREAAGL